MTKEQEIGDETAGEIPKTVFNELYQLTRPYQSIRRGPIRLVMGNIIIGRGIPQSKMLLNKYREAVLQLAGRKTRMGQYDRERETAIRNKYPKDSL